jgi:ribosomal protein S18 acetylase RimI-like enzyme
MTAPHTLLDNPVWNALSTHQAPIALGDHLARRFLPDIAPFGAVATPDEESFDNLANLVPPGESVALLGDHPALDDRWELLRQLSLVQMLYVGPPSAPVAEDQVVTSLSTADVPTMLQLVDVTHPGPFLPRTIELGQYLAIWQEGQLAAMAGERLHVPGYREISAVCTHPAYQRRGYARILVRHLMQESQRRGEIPFLHVVSENTSAIALYETLGFVPRVNLSLSILQLR